MGNASPEGALRVSSHIGLAQVEGQGACRVEWLVGATHCMVVRGGVRTTRSELVRVVILREDV